LICTRLRPLKAFSLIPRVNDIFHAPKLVSNASSHRGRNFERLMDAAKIVKHEVERQRVAVIGTANWILRLNLSALPATPCAGGRPQVDGRRPDQSGAQRDWNVIAAST
jgi:hypothetical protein